MKGILMYHSVDGSGSAISIGEDAFARHASWLADQDVVPLEALDGAGDGALAVTFDDAFANFATAAWPALRDAGVPATMYVVSDHVGKTNLWGGRAEKGVPELALMDWDELGRAAEEGLALGAHSRTHPHLTEVDDARLADEIEGGAAAIEERTGARVSSFAYPYGTHDDRVVTAAARRFARAVTTELRLVAGGEDAMRLPRLDAFYLRDAGRLEKWGTPAFGRHVARRAWLRGIRARWGRLIGR